MNNNKERHQIKRKKRKKKIVRIVLLFILALVVGAGGYAAYLVNKAQNVAADSKTDLNRGDKSDKRVEPVDPKHDNISILFMGIDDSEKRNQGSSTRTDALILATLNEDQKSVKMVSIPRDSLVYDPIRGKEDKINHAHAYNGIDGTIATVEELFDIPVDYVVRMNFEAFIDVVEALGGIDVDVPVTFTEQNSKDVHGAIHLEKGVQKLDGEEALALVRTRKIDSDIERGKRQQLVIKAIIDKAISVGSITKYGNVIEALGDNITTNLKFGEMLSLYDYAASGSKLKVESNVLEGSDLWIETQTGRAYYYQVDEEQLDELTKQLKNHLELDLTGQREDKSTKNKSTDSN